MAAPDDPSRTEPRYRFGLIPRRNRFPYRKRHWYRVVALVVALGLVAAGVPVVKHIVNTWGCSPGSPWQDSVWRQSDGRGGTECVGVAPDGYDFRHDELTTVTRRIAQQNKAARNDCPTGAKTLVGVLITTTSAEAGSRAVDQLEGMAAAQHEANQADDCKRPMVLRLADVGAEGAGAMKSARLLADEGVVAVAGMGLSTAWAAQAADYLGSQHIPMVGSVITGEGFDRDGSRTDHPDYRECAPPATYRDGIGQGYFYRVSYRNAVQLDRIAQHFPSKKRPFSFILTPTTQDDPYSCTTITALHKRFGEKVQEVRFDTNNRSTITTATERICGEKGNVDVFYAARSRHLAGFLEEMGNRFRDGVCMPKRLTVASTSDAARTRSPRDTQLPGGRWKGLDSEAFRSGRIQVVYTPLADPGVIERGKPTHAFQQLRREFRAHYEVADLDTGWAITGHDAVATIARAMDQLGDRGQAPVSGTELNTAISNFSDPKNPVIGASGRFIFGNDGNRTDGPALVRLCRSDEEPGRTSTVELKGTSDGACD